MLETCVAFEFNRVHVWVCLYRRLRVRIKLFQLYITTPRKKSMYIYFTFPGLSPLFSRIVKWFPFSLIDILFLFVWLLWYLPFIVQIHLPILSNHNLPHTICFYLLPNIYLPLNFRNLWSGCWVNGTLFYRNIHCYTMLCRCYIDFLIIIFSGSAFISS